MLENNNVIKLTTAIRISDTIKIKINVSRDFAIFKKPLLLNSLINSRSLSRLLNSFSDSSSFVAIFFDF